MSDRISSILVVAAVSACAAACDPEPGDGTSGAGGASSSTASGAGGEEVAYDGYGSVTAFNYHYAAPVDTLVAGAGASFSRPVGTSCTHDTVQSCEIYDCPTGGTASPLVSAGVIQIQGGSVDVTLTPEADGSYVTAGPLAMDLFTGGETITFDVGGSTDVPPHGGSLTAPSPATISAPVFDALVLDRAQDLTFAWSGADEAGEQVFFIVSTTESQAGQPIRTVVVQCSYDGASGQGIVPAGALSHLLATGPNVSGAALARASNETKVVAGTWLTTLLLQAATLRPSGEGATAAATVL